MVHPLFAAFSDELEKIARAGIRKGLKMVPPKSGYDGTYYYTLNGELAGFIIFKKGKVALSGLHKKHRGKRLSNAMYGMLAAYQPNKAIHSDKTLAEASARYYKSARRRSLEPRRTPGTEIEVDVPTGKRQLMMHKTYGGEPLSDPAVYAKAQRTFDEMKARESFGVAPKFESEKIQREREILNRDYRRRNRTGEVTEIRRPGSTGTFANLAAALKRATKRPKRKLFATNYQYRVQLPEKAFVPEKKLDRSRVFSESELSDLHSNTNITTSFDTD